jgi:AcrR family transcriptional regulator
MERTIMSPRNVDKEAKRRQILEAAIAAFARKGVGNTRIAEIAAEAGTGKGTIYEYFRSKEQLFQEAFGRFLQQISAEVEQRLLPLTDPGEKLAVFIQATVDSYLNYGDRADIFLDFWAESIRRRNEVLDLMKQVYDQYRQHIVSLLEEGIEAGAFKNMDTSLVASLIAGALDGLLLQWIMDREDFPLIEASKEATQVILGGIVQ